MTVVANGFEGGTPGTAITVANSGGASGDAFDAVSTTASQTLEYSNAVTIHGLVVAKFASGATAGQVYVAYGTKLGATHTIIGGRIYVYLPSAPTVFQSFARFYSGATSRAVIGVNTARRLQVLNAALGVSVTATSTLIPILDRCRIEFSITLDASAGSVDSRLWLPANAESTGPADETITATAQNFGGTGNEVRVGMTSSVASSVAHYMDSVELNNTGAFPGPLPVTYPVGVAEFDKLNIAA